MKSLTFILAIVLIAFVATTPVRAQDDLAGKLSKMGSDAAKGYVTPIFEGWGAALNSGFYHSADLHDILGFDVGVKIALARMTDESKTYSLDMPASLTFNYKPNATTTIPVTFVRGTDYDATVTAPTAVGDKNAVDVKSKVTKTVAGQPAIAAGTTIFTLPGGFDLPAVPLPMPQVAVGLPFGLEVIGRFIPTVSAGDAGKFNYMGFGARYDIDQWIPLFPIDIAAHFVTQKMNFKDADDKDVFSAGGTAYGVEISKKLLILTLYGGFQLESSTFSLASFTGYDATTGQNITINGFDIDGKNKSRITVGARILLLLINAHVEYSVAETPVITAGVGISIR